MSDEKKKRFGIFKILVLLVVLVLAAVIALPFLIDANQFRPKVETEITGALGRVVKVGNLKLSLLSGGVAADDISIADDPAFSQSPFVQAKSLRVGVGLRPLIFSRVVHITSITLDQPEITLVRSASGEWNFSSIGGKEKSMTHQAPTEASGDPAVSNVTVSLLRVTNGRVTMLRGGARAKPRVYDRVNVEARDLSYSSIMPFVLSAGLPGGGDLKIDGKAGPINRLDASLTPFSGTITMNRMDLIASGLVEPDSGLAGIIDFNGSLGSDGKTLSSKGRAKAERFQVLKTGSPAPKPVAIDYEIAQNLRDQTGTLSDAKIEFGKAVAHLSGTFDAHGESTALKAKFRGENLPAEDLEALLPAIGVTLPRGAALDGGMVNADLAAEGPLEKLVTTGTVAIANTRLTGFDLGSKMAAVASLAGIKPSTVTEIQKFASELQLAQDGIKAENLELIVPSLGQLNGSGRVGSNNSLDFKMTAKLNTGGGIVGGLGKLTGARTGNELTVPFFIRGTTSDPKFVPDAKGVATGLLDSALSGKGEKAGDGTQGQSLGDTLRGIFKKRKQ